MPKLDKSGVGLTCKTRSMSVRNSIAQWWKTEWHPVTSSFLSWDCTKTEIRAGAILWWKPSLVGLTSSKEPFVNHAHSDSLPIAKHGDLMRFVDGGLHERPHPPGSCQRAPGTLRSQRCKDAANTVECTSVAVRLSPYQGTLHGCNVERFHDHHHHHHHHHHRLYW